MPIPAPPAPRGRSGRGRGAHPGRALRRLARGAIADAADRGDVSGRLGVVAELLAQPADVDVDRAVEDRGVVAAVDHVEELVAGEDPAAGLEEDLEQPELDAGQRDRPAIAGDLVAVGIEDEVGVAEAGGGCGGAGPRSARSAARAGRSLEDPPDADDELGGAERLREVVVGAVLETGDAVDGRAAGRQHEDRDVAVGLPADRADDGAAVELGEHEVEDDQGGIVVLDRGQRGRPVAGGHDLVPLALQVRAHEPDDLRVVVDDEDRSSRTVRGGSHRRDATTRR